MKKDKTLYQFLRSVQDPELRESIVDLGLIYGIEQKEGVVYVTMTLTTPFCPLAPEMQHAIKSRLLEHGQITDVAIDLVWDPPWDASTMASNEIKDKLGLW